MSTVQKVTNLPPKYIEDLFKDLFSNLYNVDPETGMVSGLLSKSPLEGTPIFETDEEGNQILDEDGNPIPVASMQGSVVLPSGADGPAFLAYSNFRTTMIYNPSTFYALTVGHLADRFTGGGPVQRMPDDEQPMSIADVQELQILLNGLGFNSGEPDGRVGRQTRSAIRAYQSQSGLPTDGHASVKLLESLRGQQ